MGKKKDGAMFPSVWETPIANTIQREVKFKPTEWAIQEGLDKNLFIYWENQMMTKAEFDILKTKRGV